jgi:[ribosomal protein S18]-alanine N-acetyltransferase
VSAQPLGASFRLEPLKRKHMRDVLTIERAVYVRPWSAALFFSEISQKKTRYYLAAFDDETLVGYAGLMVHADDGHITNIAVHPDHQSRGIGARLLFELVLEARSRGARQVTLEVRVANWPAQRLYSWFGFRPLGIRRNYYAETGEDALVMVLKDAQDDETGHRLERIAAQLNSTGLKPPSTDR